MKKAIKITFLSLGIIVVLACLSFFITRKLDNNVMAGRYANNVVYDQSAPYRLSSRFIKGERFYILLPRTSGDSLLAYGDTGGGLTMIPAPMVDRLNVNTHWALMGGIMPMRYSLFSEVVADKRIPPPVSLPERIVRRFFMQVSEPHFLVPPADEELKFAMKAMAFDAFLGQDFFMCKAWTFDYLKQEVWVNTPLPAAAAGTPGVLKLGFGRNSFGDKIWGHPRMVVAVDGELIEVLFDTGASIVLSEEGKKLLNIQEHTLGGSFIAASVFDEWRQKHPDWKYYPGADCGVDVIEVPAVTIAGHTVGPVLFARRPDEAWSVGMIRSMDKVVRGAIGGSAFKYFKVTIDYNSDLVKFER